MKDVLEAREISTDTASTGFEAIDCLRSTLYDLVLMDIRMPGMDGIETYKRLKKIHNEITVIFITAYASHVDETEIKKEGCMLLLKPVNIEELIQIIESKASHEPIPSYSTPRLS
jgi:CheY-like chemotaxis protein